MLTNQQVVDFLRVKIANTGSILFSVNLIMEKCLAPSIEYIGIGCDNMTVVVVAILNGKTKEAWLQGIKESVDKQGLSGSYTPDGGDTEKEGDGSEAYDFDDEVHEEQHQHEIVKEGVRKQEGEEEKEVIIDGTTEEVLKPF